MSERSGMKGFQRADLARRTGCRLDAVRYYGKVGLLPALAALLSAVWLAVMTLV